MAVRMELVRVLMSETQDTHIVELCEVDGGCKFPIVIGYNEAAAIERRLMGQQPPRPQTHELLANVIEQLGGKMERVVICDLKDHTFYAQLVIKQGGQVQKIDSRPSDAIALGAATDIPIYVEEHVLDEVCRS